jgi:putative membrane protein
MWHMMDSWTGYSVFGVLFMLLFWALIVLGIIALVRYLSGAQQPKSKRKDPLDILEDRYAKGEISKKEFEEKKKDLS